MSNIYESLPTKDLNTNYLDGNISKYLRQLLKLSANEAKIYHDYYFFVCFSVLIMKVPLKHSPLKQKTSKVKFILYEDHALARSCSSFPDIIINSITCCQHQDLDLL